jgi:hypothetical protein
LPLRAVINVVGYLARRADGPGAGPGHAGPDPSGVEA